MLETGPHIILNPALWDIFDVGDYGRKTTMVPKAELSTLFRSRPAALRITDEDNMRTDEKLPRRLGLSRRSL